MPYRTVQHYQFYTPTLNLKHNFHICSTNYYITSHKCPPWQDNASHTWCRSVCPSSRSQAKVKWKNHFWSITYTSFNHLISNHIAKMSTITRQCVMYMFQAHMSKVKVKHKDKTENSFTMHNLRSLTQLYPLAQSMTRWCVTNMTKVCMSKVK